MNLMLHEKRLIATLIDAGIVLVLSLINLIFFGPLFNMKFFSYDYFFLISFTLIMIFFQGLSLFFFRDKTLGLVIVGTRVVSKDLKILDIKQIILRAVSISIPILFVVNIAYVFINKNTKTIFDVISNSVVVNNDTDYSLK